MGGEACAEGVEHVDCAWDLDGNVSLLLYGLGLQLLTPLKPMHFNPTSRISSAVATASPCGAAAWYSSESESGEFMVMVVAV